MARGINKQNQGALAAARSEAQLYREWYRTARKPREELVPIWNMTQDTPQWNKYIRQYERAALKEQKEYSAWKEKRKIANLPITPTLSGDLLLSGTRQHHEPSRKTNSASSAKPISSKPSHSKNSGPGRKASTGRGSGTLF